MSTDLQQFRKLPEYRDARPHVFPTLNSLQWYFRRNRRAMVEAGAAVLLNSQWHLHETKCDDFIAAEATRQAQRRMRRDSLDDTDLVVQVGEGQ